jgi:cytochrome c5
VSQQDRMFVSVFKAVLVFLVVLTIVIFILARLIGGEQEASKQQDTQYVKALEERIAPVGKVNLGAPGAAPAPSAPAAPAAQPPAAARSGKEIVESTCAACHSTGVLGAPKLGDKAAWQARTAQGLPALVQHALQGFKQMPAKGGNPALSEDDIKKAVGYMLEQVGIAPEKSSSALPAGVPGGPAVIPAGAPDLAQGKQVYSSACFACHGTGVAGAPKPGDKAAWQPRAT